MINGDRVVCQSLAITRYVASFSGMVALFKSLQHDCFQYQLNDKANRSEQIKQLFGRNERMAGCQVNIDILFLTLQFFNRQRINNSAFFFIDSKIIRNVFLLEYKGKTPEETLLIDMFVETLYDLIAKYDEVVKEKDTSIKVSE